MIRSNYSQESRLLTFCKKGGYKNLIKIVDLLEGIVKNTNENIDYGNLYILNEYAGVPFGTKIVGRIQHGWAVGFKSGTAYANNFMDSFVWSENTEAWAMNKGWNNMKAIGAPWLYLLAILEKDGWLGKKLELIESRSIDQLWVYGLHSMSIDDGIQRDLINFLDIARTTGKGNIAVLLSYTDFDGLSKATFDRFSDLQIFTLGHRRNLSSANSHLYRLFDLLRNTKEVHLDYPSTLLLYAITLNCEVRWIPNSSFTLAKQSAIAVEDSLLTELLGLEKINPSKYKQFAYEYLGKESFKSPKELRSMFGWSDAGLGIFQKIHRKSSSLAALPYRFTKIFIMKSTDGL
jgi:hypothetical protein